MSKALKKLTIAYLALQDCADKLQADKDAMFIENQTLSHKLKQAKENNRFLQQNSEKTASNIETLIFDISEQADEMRQLKAENERLRAYVIEKDGIQPANDLAVSIDPATGESAVYREDNGVIEVSDAANPETLYTLKAKSGYLLSISNAGMPIFGTTRQSALYIKFFRVIDYYKFYYNAANNDQCELAEVAIVDLHNPTIWDNDKKTSYVLKNDGIKILDEVQPAPTLQELEKADAPNPDALILLADKKSGYYVHGKYLNEKQQTELLFTPNKELADTFANLEEVHDFLDDYPLENLNLRGSINMVIVAKDDNGFIQGVLDAGGSWRTLVYHDDICYAKEFDDLGGVINFLDEFTTENVTLMGCNPDNWHIELSISLDDAIKQYKDALQDLQVKTTEI